MSARRRWAAAVALAACTTASAAPTVVRFEGYAYEAGTGRYLYTEVHAQELDADRWLGGSITYVAPDGSVLARKDLRFAGDPFIPEYRLTEEKRTYVQGVRLSGTSLEMYRQGRRQASPQTALAERSAATVANTGIHAFIRAHFDELLRGATVDFLLADPDTLDRYAFRVRRIDDAVVGDVRAVRFEARPASLLRLLVDPLVLTYDPAQQRLLEYSGPSDIHDPETGAPYKVTVHYLAQRPADAPRVPGALLTAR